MAYSQSWINSTPADPCVVTVSPTANDVLIAYQINDVTNAAGAAPTGFSATALVDISSTFDNSRLTVWIKQQATGSETSVSLNGASNAIIGGVLAFSGIDNTTSLDVAAASFADSVSGTTASASLTPVTNGCDIVAILDADTASVDSTFSFATTSGTTGAWTGRTDQNSGFYNVGTGTATQTTAGAITVQGTQSNAGGRLFALLALRPSTPSGPTINTQPSGLTVFDGASATFSVTATTSGGALSYQWQDNSGGSFANIGGATSASLTVLASLTMSGRLYRVNVTDSNGTTPSNSAPLYVTEIIAAWPPQQSSLRQIFKRGRSTLWLLDPKNWGGIPLDVAKWFAPELSTAAGGGGGTTYNDSVAETGAAVDTVTVSAVFAAAVAETANAADTVTAAAITAAAIAETGSAADTVTATATLNAVIAETLTAVDTPDALLTFIAQVSEVLSGVDTVTASALFNAAVAETLAAVDTVTASALFNAVISETLSAVDTTDATITGAGGTTYNDSVAETLNAVDTVSASALYAGAVAEALSAADSIDALLTQLGVIAEALAATETVNGLITATAAVSETGAASDTVTSLLVTTASIQEVVNAVETITAQTNFNASITEAMNATDSTDATGGSAPVSSGHAYWIIFKRRTRR